MRHLRVLIVLAGLTSGVVVQSSECPEDRRPMSQRVAELSEVYSVFAGRAVPFALRPDAPPLMWALGT